MRRLFLFFLFVLGLSLTASNYELSADSNRVVLGTPLKVNLKASVFNRSELLNLMRIDSLGQFKVLKYTQIDTITSSQNETQLSIDYLVASYTEGNRTLGPLELPIDGFNYRSNLLEIEVYVPQEVRPRGQQIKDIYGILDIEYQPPWLLIILLTIAGVVVLFFMIKLIRFLLKRQKEKAENPIPVDPYEHATTQLLKLEQEDLMIKNGKEYCVRLSHILREYIEYTTGESALESTTKELIKLLKPYGAFALEQVMISQLNQMDLVKFATFTLGIDEYKQMHYQVKEYLKSTKIYLDQATKTDTDENR